MKRRQSIAAVLALAILILLLPVACGGPKYTLAQYKDVKIGMTRAHVADIMGDEGDVVSTNSDGTYNMVLVSYGDYGSGMSFMFTNGRLDYKQQAGLK